MRPLTSATFDGVRLGKHDEEKRARTHAAARYPPTSMHAADAPPLTHAAPWPARGSYEPGFEPVAKTFARLLAAREEIGAGFVVHHRGRRVVDVWGGHADARAKRPWEADTRAVVFSVTKGLAAMALNMLADRGRLDWDATVASVWPGFARAGKERITLRTLFNHRAGLPYLDAHITLSTCIERWDLAVDAIERQRPAWEPERGQGYHALTFGIFAREIFERLAGESMGTFLKREVFDPLGSDARLGTEEAFDAKMSTLYPPSGTGRIGKMTHALVTEPEGLEARMLRNVVSPRSIARRAFSSPRPDGGLAVYGTPKVWRAELPWASATASARGISRAYLPFASGGEHAGRRYVRAETLATIARRQGWSERDAVLNKPVGWSQAFLKEEPQLFSPELSSFGHAGLGGALGWCDPVNELAIGYVLNRLDWHVRSPRAIALCRSLYACDPVRERG